MNKLRDRIHLGNKEKGFWDKERNFGELLMLVTSELAEALEAHRGRGNTLDKKAFELETAKGEEFKDAFEKYIKDTVEDEIADSIIRLLDLCGGLNIDIEWHIEQKLKFNATREKLHGKKY